MNRQTKEQTDKLKSYMLPCYCMRAIKTLIKKSILMRRVYSTCSRKW